MTTHILKTLQLMHIHVTLLFSHITEETNSAKVSASRINIRWKLCFFFADVHLFVLSNKDNEFKTVVGGILLPLDSITMLCKRHTVLRDPLTPTILNVVIISATELGPPAQFKFIVVSLSKIPSKILQLHEMLQTFQLFLKTVRQG